MKKLFKLHLTSGFTLVELIIVIGLIGVLAGVLLTVINPLGQFEKARDAQRKSDLAQIQRALEMYYQDNGKYPSTGTFSFGSPWTSGGPNATKYMNLVPKDPGSFNYVYTGSGDTYHLCAHLEMPDDPQILTSGTCASTSCGTANCNYGVSSPNTSP